MQTHVRRLACEDLSARVTWFNSEVVFSQMTIKHPISLPETQAWYNRITTQSNRVDVVFEDRGKANVAKLVAMGGLLDINVTNQNAELYVVVNPQMTGRGIGSRAVCWLCNYGFDVLSLQKIYLYTLATNEGARRLYDRLGFQAEGILRAHVHHAGRLVDRYVQSVLREEWQELWWCATVDPLPEETGSR